MGRLMALLRQITGRTQPVVDPKTEEWVRKVQDRQLARLRTIAPDALDRAVQETAAGLRRTRQ